MTVVTWTATKAGLDGPSRTIISEPVEPLVIDPAPEQAPSEPTPVETPEEVPA